MNKYWSQTTILPRDWAEFLMLFRLIQASLGQLTLIFQHTHKIHSNWTFMVSIMQEWGHAIQIIDSWSLWINLDFRIFVTECGSRGLEMSQFPCLLSQNISLLHEMQLLGIMCGLHKVTITLAWFRPWDKFNILSYSNCAQVSFHIYLHGLSCLVLWLLELQTYK